MLFDLSGKRKRVVQVVYGVLALLFAVTFVGFGIGSDAAGGIFDAIGLGSNDSGGSSSPQLERDIEAQEDKLAANPEDRQALLELARLHALDAASEISADPNTGAVEISDTGRQRLEESAAAWQRYLRTDPPTPDASAAITMVKQVYIPLNDAGGAAEAQAIYAEQEPSSNAYATLAQFYYFDGEVAAGDEAAKRAVEEADSSTRESLEKQLSQLSKQAAEFAKAQKQARKEAPEGGEPNPLENPFGQLGASPGTGALTP